MLNKEKFKEKLGRMIPNPLRLALKMFGLVWFFLVLQVVLKLTFNYWQPYVMPTEQLQSVSNYIDSHMVLQTIIFGITYLFNGTLVILCCLRQWWFKSKKETIIVLSLIILGYLSSVFLNDVIIHTLFLSIVLPLILKPKNWLWIILTFIISNVFTIVSFLLANIVKSTDMNFLTNIFMQNDYYIMLILFYLLFNLIRMKQEMK